MLSLKLGYVGAVTAGAGLLAVNGIDVAAPDVFQAWEKVGIVAVLLLMLTVCVLIIIRGAIWVGTKLLVSLQEVSSAIAANKGNGELINSAADKIGRAGDKIETATNAMAHAVEVCQIQSRK